MNKLFILLLFSENVETQLTGSGTTGQRYSPLEKDAVKMKSMLTIVFYLKKMCTPEFHGSYESNEVEDAVCKTESKANFLSVSSPIQQPCLQYSRPLSTLLPQAQLRSR